MSNADRDMGTQSADDGRDAGSRIGDVSSDVDAQLRDRERDMDIRGGVYGQDLGVQGRTPVLDADMGTYGDQMAGTGSPTGDLAQKGEGPLERAEGVFDKGVGSVSDDANSAGLGGSPPTDSVQDTFSDADGRSDRSDADTAM